MVDYTTMERRRFSVVGVAVNDCNETWRLSPAHFPEGGPNGVTVRSHRHGDNLIVVAMGTVASVHLVDGAINWTHRE